MPQAPNRILIIQTAFIGDVVLATPLVEKLHHFFPEAKIDFLLRKGNENLLSHHPILNKIWVWEKEKDKIKNLLQLTRAIRQQHYDVTINLQRFFSSGFLAGFSGATKILGYKKNPLSFLFTKAYRHDIGNGKHEVERNLSLIEEITDDSYFPPRLYPSKLDFDRVEFYKGEEYVVLAPTSVWYTKQFPKEKWVEFLRLLDSKYKVYLIGAPTDFDWCQDIIDAAEKGINLCGKLSLMESTALIKHAKMNYVNDSAPMHFASAVNAPVTAIFCSTIPDFGFGPLAESSYMVQVQEKLTCRPCGLHGRKTCPKKHFKCGQDIDVHELNRKLNY